MKRYAILVAGGSGKRMEAATPKQFMELKGLPVLMHTINTFTAFDPATKLIVVLAEEEVSTWKGLCQTHQFTTKHTVVKGGAERFYSVLEGLNTIKGDGIIAIHDGVRPLVSQETLKNCFLTAAEKGNAVPIMPIVESMRAILGDTSEPINRKKLRIVQTPQCFEVAQIKAAYKQHFKPEFTDDATVLEANGGTIYLTSGNRENIKITTRADLRIAEALL